VSRPARARGGHEVPGALGAHPIVAGGVLAELVDCVGEVGELVKDGIGPERDHRS
jgi:hypothetical protein